MITRQKLFHLKKDLSSSDINLIRQEEQSLKRLKIS